MKIETKGLDSIINTLEKFEKMPEKADKILNKLCEIGAEKVKEAHETVNVIDHLLLPDGESKSVAIRSDAEVRVDREGNSHFIEAEGKNFLFFEFGAGMKHNKERDWGNELNIPVPDEIADIGTYGSGRGKHQSWVYLTPTKERVRTGGYKAVAGFANAINAIVANTEKTIKEVMDE